MSGARTPLGHYSTSSISGTGARPRSSMSGNYTHSHSHSQSLSMTSSLMRANERERDDEGSDGSARTPLARRSSTLGDKIGGSAIPTPSGLPRRQSAGRRVSSGVMEGEMGPPERPPGRSRKLSDLGETY
jgi:hypothetical protein